jgi:LPS sulfotransferase NodH
MRLMQPSLPELCAVLVRLFPHEPTDAARFAAAFGTPLYLFVHRRDKVAQAVSRMRAEQSGLWHRNADGSTREQLGTFARPRYDAAQIRTHLQETEQHEAAWQAWFATSSITPRHLAYEDLAANPAAELAALLTTLGRHPRQTAGLAPRTARLANDESREWTTRFRRERG